MSSSGIAPARSSYLKVGLVPVHDTCHGKLRHGLWLLHKLYVRTDDTEVITHIDEGHLYAVTCHSVEYETGRISLAAYSERMHLYLGLACSKGCRHLQHMGSELKLLSLREVVGIVLYEACSSVESLCHLHQHS